MESEEAETEVPPIFLVSVSIVMFSPVVCLYSSWQLQARVCGAGGGEIYEYEVLSHPLAH